jgi:dynein heavy chain
MLFINDSDVGWRPFFDSWLSKYKHSDDEHAETVFQLSLSTYCSDSFIDDNRNKSHISPICDIAQIKTLTCIIDHLYDELHHTKALHDYLKKLKEEPDGENEIKTIYEAYFVFAAMWAFGGSLNEDKLSFSNQWKSMSKIKFPDAGQCFDYFYDVLEKNWKHWDDVCEKYNTEYEGLFNNLVVPTAETTRQNYLLNLHVKAKKGMLYVGIPGTGKTTIIQNYFGTLDKEATLNASINFNSYTDSKALQIVIESQVDKRAGRTYGPPPSKTLIYFMDDLNMPKVDKYGTQDPICLVRQIIDYGLVFDRDHLEEKKNLVDIMFTACMNPKGGSFIVDMRLTRHFTMISCLTAEKDILSTIYFQILENHMRQFDK